MSVQGARVYSFKSRAGRLVARIRALSEEHAWKALRDCVVDGKLSEPANDDAVAVVMYDASEVPDRSAIRRRQYQVAQEA